MHIDPQLVRHVRASTGLRESEARRLVQDVLAFHDEPLEAWVRRRHAALQARGVRNAEIYPQLLEELRGHLVAAPQLSERQLRRIIYT